MPFQHAHLTISHLVNGESENFTDSKQSLFDTYSLEIQMLFRDDANAATKKDVCNSRSLRRKTKNSTPTSRNVKPVPFDIDQCRPECPSTDSRLKMHHLMQYVDTKTQRGHTVVIFTLFPGTDIMEEISKDGREVSFRIQTPERLTAKQFVNKEKISKADYDVDDDDQRQCMMAYFKCYEPEEYIYRVELPDAVMSHPDYVERWWSIANGGRVLVTEYTHQSEEDFSFAIQHVSTL